MENKEFCEIHDRKIECFCKNCLEIICPSCLMFGNHKGHNVCTLEEAKIMIDSDIQIVIDNGLFDQDGFKKKLLDIKYSKFKTEEVKQKLKSEVNCKFDIIYKKLKNREQEILMYIENEFKDIYLRVEKTEKKWDNIKKNSKEIIELISNKENNILDCVQKSKNIYKLIHDLQKTKDKIKIDYPDNLNFEFTMVKDKKQLNFTIDEFLESIESFVKPNSFTHIQYNS